MKNTSLAIFILIGGGLLCTAALALYFIGLPIINNLLKESTPREDLVQSIRITWVLCSITLFLCGVWGMFIAVSVRKNMRYLQKQALSLGSGVVAFGIYGLLYNFPNWKFITFILVGLLILVPGLLLNKEESKLKT